MCTNNKEYFKQYYETHKSAIRATQKKYNKTKMGRACSLLNSYNDKDKLYERGKGDLTAKWIIEHIFSQPCAHCGKKGWKLIGCNRLDNSKPHTTDNVEPCCEKCNIQLHANDNKTELAKEVHQFTLSGELVHVWRSTSECGRNGFDCGHISQCCNGKRKTHKGFIWKYA